MEPKKRKHAGVLASCACSESVRRYRSGSHSLLCFAHARHVLSPPGRELERGQVLPHSQKISTAPRVNFYDKASTCVEVLIAIISDVKQTFYFRDDSVSRRQERVRENKMFALAFTLAEVLYPKKLYSCAFTLAEVLIVLGILGLVADMTIPTLHQNITEKVTVTKLKNSFSLFNEAFKMLEVQDGSADTWGLGSIESIITPNPDGGNDVSYDTPANTASSKILMDKFVKNLKVLKYCDSNDKSCFYQKEENMKVYSATLANGTSFYAYPNSSTCSGRWADTQALRNVCAILMVDIDGPNKGKSEGGKDIFGFFISKYGLIPLGTTVEGFNTCKNKLSGDYCAAWIIYNGNMDYLRCNDLSWDGSHYCK